MLELSVIVPVYNAEKYIGTCISSIISQSFKDFEVIIVDDGSTDNTSKICNYYARQDTRIKVIHQNNMGVSIARNAALRVAQGKYLSFVDSDDWIEKNMYEHMINVLNYTQSDIAICQTTIHYDDSSVMENSLSINKMELSQSELIAAFFKKPNGLGGGCCNKIIRNYHLLFDDNISIGEDSIFLFESILLSKKGCITKGHYYNVRECKSSLTRKDPAKTWYDLLESYLVIIQKARICDRVVRDMALDKFLDTCILAISFEERKGLNKNPSIIKRIKTKMLKAIVEGIISRSIKIETILNYIPYIIKNRLTSY